MTDDFKKIEINEKYATDMESMNFLLDQAQLTFQEHLNMLKLGTAAFPDKEKVFMEDWINQYAIAKTRLYRKMYNTSLH